MEATINVAVFGKTGVGKSTLINYLFDETRRMTGSGKPITVKGFFEGKKEINGVTITLIDSWGIEQNKTSEWNQLFHQYLESRITSEAIEEWMHAAIYCIDVSGDRIEDIDIEIIQTLIAAKIPVIVAFTKAIFTTNEALDKLTSILQEALIYEDELVILPVNSKEVTDFNGNVYKPFGKQEILAAIHQHYIQMLYRHLPAHIFKTLQQRIYDFAADIGAATNINEAILLYEHYHTCFWERDLRLLIQQELWAALRMYEGIDQTVFAPLYEDPVLAKIIASSSAVSEVDMIDKFTEIKGNLIPLLKRKELEKIAERFCSHAITTLHNHWRAIVDVMVETLNCAYKKL